MKPIKSELFRPTKHQIHETFSPIGGTSFLDLPPNERIVRFSQYLQTPSAPNLERATLPEMWKKLGVVVIKPEAFELREYILKHVQDLGIKVLHTQKLQYNNQQLWNVYSQALSQYPETTGVFLPGLLLNHTNGVSFVIAFEHASASEYIKIFEAKNGVAAEPYLGLLPDSNDSQSVFKRLFVGSGSDLPPGSIREILQRLLIDKGFDTLHQYPTTNFDPTSELGKNERVGGGNLRTFNGIHSPATAFEVAEFVQDIMSKRTISRIKKSL